MHGRDEPGSGELERTGSQSSQCLDVSRGGRNGHPEQPRFLGFWEGNSNGHPKSVVLVTLILLGPQDGRRAGRCVPKATAGETRVTTPSRNLWSPPPRGPAVRGRVRNALEAPELAPEPDPRFHPGRERQRGPGRRHVPNPRRKEGSGKKTPDSLRVSWG